MTYSKSDLSIYWVSVDKIEPNPFQPRHVFNDQKLEGLSNSIRRYGVLQPLVVTKKEDVYEDGNMDVRYQLIAGERRLRASKLAGLKEVPVVIRNDVEDDNIRLELAIIENLQREDLNPIDKAKAFKQLVDDFDMKHTEVANKIGRSREYISNSIRVLSLPEKIISAIYNLDISEGHSKPLLMLSDKPEEQDTLFEDIINRKLTVREAEKVARKLAVDRIRKKDKNPRLKEMETVIEQLLGTSVYIEKRGAGGKITIDFFNDEELDEIAKKLGNDFPETEEETPIDNDVSDESNDDDMYSFRNFSL